MKKELIIKNLHINFFSQKKEDFICLSDITRFKDAERVNYIVQNWMRMRSTIEFLGLWGKIHNPNFKGIAFEFAS